MSQPEPSQVLTILEALGRRRGLIVGLVVLATVVAVVVSLVLPKYYTSTALLLPPPQESQAGGLAQLVDVELFSAGSRMPGLITLNDVYARILRSRRIYDRLIEKFDLMTLYGGGRTAVYKVLDDKIDVRVTEEGLLQIAVEDKDPQLAADMANTCVEGLIELNRDLVSNTVKEKREFIEARLHEVSVQLDSARTDLEQFQIKNRAVNFDEQTALAIEQATNLKVSEASLVLDISILENELGKDNPELVERRRRLKVIREQLHDLEWGGDDSSFFSLPVSAVPTLRGEYESLYTKVKVNETLYRTLLELLEQARIQEKEYGPTIAVLDWPTVPDLRSKPQRSLIVIGTFAIALVFSVLLALWLEYVRRLREQRYEDYERLMVFASAYFGWLPGVKRPPTRDKQG